jgi:hypothetical protein
VNNGRLTDESDREELDEDELSCDSLEVERSVKVAVVLIEYDDNCCTVVGVEVDVEVLELLLVVVVQLVLAVTDS